jgi:hypothetical protein
MRHAIGLAVDMARDPRFVSVSDPLYHALQEPFAIEMLNEQRRSALLFLSEVRAGGVCSSEFVDVIKSYEPHIPWQATYLERRARCYQETGDPMAAQARRDLENFRRGEPGSLEQLAAPTPGITGQSPPR